MTNALRKIALPATIAIFCALIGVNAYVAAKSLKVIANFAALRADAADAQSAIVAVDLDLQHIESGQRGYLLTGNDSYLTPYTEAVQKSPKDFSALRSRLARRTAQERSFESDLEAVTESKIDDADQTIRLRQKGYRHRAFLIVDSNRGRDLMDKARSLVDSLSAMETHNIAQYQQQLTGSTHAALEQGLLANLALLALTIIVLIAFDWSGKRLERAHRRQADELRATSETLERWTAALSTNVRATLTELQIQSDNLLNVDGGFLPRQGQEKAQWIRDASCYVGRLIDDLLQPDSSKAAMEPTAQEVSIDRRDPEAVTFDDAAELPRSHTA